MFTPAAHTPSLFELPFPAFMCVMNICSLVHCCTSEPGPGDAAVFVEIRKRTYIDSMHDGAAAYVVAALTVGRFFLLA